MLVRHLAGQAERADSNVHWVRPIDVDDSEYWKLSNLESEVATQLGRQLVRGLFRIACGACGQAANQQVSYETGLTDSAGSTAASSTATARSSDDRDATVVITLDTFEAIRSMYLLLTLTRWMKELPRTLFILSGRPPVPGEPDPLREELTDRHRPLPPVEMRLRGFADAEARRFLEENGLHASLSPAEQDRLISLTDRQPLWLALSVEYLRVDDDLVPSRRCGRRTRRPHPTPRRSAGGSSPSTAAPTLGPRQSSASPWSGTASPRASGLS